MNSWRRPPFRSSASRSEPGNPSKPRGILTFGANSFTIHSERKACSSAGQDIFSLCTWHTCCAAFGGVEGGGNGMSNREKDPVKDIIARSYDKLTKSEKRIGEYILTNLEEAAFLTSTRLAQKANVSEATVLRFSSKLGYSGFPPLQEILQNRIKERLKPSDKLRKYTRLKGKNNIPDEIFSSIIRKAFVIIKKIISNEKTNLYKWARMLALFTVFYNIIEGLVSVYFGVKDETLTLFGFGIDSFVEVISGIGIWHMLFRIKANGEERDEFEKRALKITGTAFYILVA